MGAILLEAEDFIPYVEAVPALASITIIGLGETLPAISSADLSGAAGISVLGSAGIGDPDSVPGLGSLGIGDPDTVAALGVIDALDARARAALGSLDVGDSQSENARALASIDVGTSRSGQAGALGGADVRGRHGAALIASVDWTLTVRDAFPASIDIAFHEGTPNLGTIVLGLTEKTAAEASVEVKAGTGFALGVDIIDPVIDTGRGDAGC